MHKPHTISSFAREQMSKLALALLEVSESTQSFTNPSRKAWKDRVATELLLCGKGYSLDEIAELPSAEKAWADRLSQRFSIEGAVTGTLYERLESFTTTLIASAYSETKNFDQITTEWIRANPHFLPVLMHVLDLNKQSLLTRFRSAGDQRISRPASIKLAEAIIRMGKARPAQSVIRERIKRTVEGVVRDLSGKVLREQFVAVALQRHGIPFKRESEYNHIQGVIYDFRADFVIPEPDKPLALIEVRKSSSRHASGYAKDKMFSAINWKGQHERCLAVLVLDGPWTGATLDILGRIFDYVFPIEQVDQMAEKIRAYLDGDDAVLQWLITFRILQNVPGQKPRPAKRVHLSEQEIDLMAKDQDD